MHRLMALAAAAICISSLILAGCGRAEDRTSDSSALFPVSVEGKWGYIDRTGAIVIEPQFRYADDFFDGFASVWLDNGGAAFDGGGFIDTTGTVVYQHPNCVGIGRFSEGLASQRMRFDGMDPDTMVFYCDVTGEAAFDRGFAYGLPFHEGYAAVETDILVLWDFERPEKWRYIDKEGTFLATPEFDSAESFSQGLACVEADGKYGYIDQSGAFAIELQFNSAYTFSEGLAGVMTGSKGGYIDKTGNWVIDLADGTVPRGASSVFSEGLAAVWRGEEAGYIDKNGAVAIEPQFYDATPFSEGLAAVCLERDGPWGYIDKTGAMVIQPQYYKVEAFRNGLARVYLDSRRGILAYVDKTDNLIWQGSTRPPASTTSTSVHEQTTPAAGVATWTAVNPAGDLPPARSFHSTVYNPSTGHVLLFGGLGWGSLNDTWAYDPAANSWTDLNPAGDLPSPRSQFSMVHDSANDQVILFGGASGLHNSDETWIYDPIGNTWTNPRPTGALPPARVSHSMVYDSANNQVILFGGADHGTFRNDTWAYDPAANTWTDLKPTSDLPSPRFGFSMVYDSANDRVILFGGHDGSHEFNDTWAYDPTHNAWTSLNPSGSLPSTGGSNSMVYDPTSGRAILFGGYDSATSLCSDSTWVYDPAANTWAELNPAGGWPPARTGHSLVYDSTSGLVILFGGRDNVSFNDTWTCRCNLIWQGSSRPTASTTSTSIPAQTTTTMVPSATKTPPEPTSAREVSRVRWGQGSGVCDDGAPGSLGATLYRPCEIPDNGLMKNPQSNKLVAMPLEIGNKGPHKNAFGVVPSTWFFLVDVDGNLYSCQGNLQVGGADVTTQILEWGQTVEGYVVFEIPNEAEPAVGICAPFASDYWLTWSD